MVSDSAIVHDRAANGANPIVLTVAVAFMTFTTGAIYHVMSPLLPSLRTVYNVSLVDVSWVFTLLSFGSALGVAIIPRLSDITGDRLTLTLCPASMAVGLGLAATGSFPALLIAGLGIGVGLAASSVSIAALRRILSESAISRVITVTVAVTFLGSAVGYVLGPLAVELVSLRVYFIVTAMLAAAVSVIVYATFPQTKPTERGSLGLASIGVLILWLFSILFAISKGKEWGWADPKTLSVIIFGVLAGLLWGLRERKLKTPVMDFALLANPRFQVTLIAALSMGVGAVAVGVLVPALVQANPAAGYGLTVTPLGAGLLLLPYAFFAIPGVSLAGRFTACDRPVMAAGLGALGHCCAAVWLAFFHDSVWQILVGTAVYGLGVGMLNGGAYGSVQSVIPPEKAGMGNSMLSLVAVLAGAVAPILYSVILVSRSVDGLPGVPAEGQFTVAFLANAAVDATCALACFVGMRRSRAGSAHILGAGPAKLVVYAPQSGKLHVERETRDAERSNL